jgi:PPP family 3-phenylpropionic acid transporter
MEGIAMNARHGTLFKFVLLYCGLFSAFALVSPFLPPFLAERGLRPEQLGMVLGAGTAVRLLFGPFAGRLAHRFHIFRAELAIFTVLAASAALAYFAVNTLWLAVVVSLFQAAALAPLVPLADALSSLMPVPAGRGGLLAALNMGAYEARARQLSSAARCWRVKSPGPTGSPR